MKAATSSIRSELEETIRHGMEDVLASVNERTGSLGEELSTKKEETQMELQTPLDTRDLSLRKETADPKKDLFRVPIRHRNHMARVTNAVERSRNSDRPRGRRTLYH